jgi:protein TonB
MLKPQHVTADQLRTSQGGIGRVVSIGLVGAIHAAVIYALATGLAAQVTSKIIQEVQVAVVKEKPPDIKPPPPPPPEFKVPPPDYVPPPEISIAAPAQTSAITNVQKVAKVAPPPPVVTLTPPKAVGSTHNCETYYPPLSRRLSEQGKVLLKYDIDTQGNISNARVAKSSGYSRLDQAATQCVNSRWRSTPAMRGNTPVAATLEAYVVFQLR